MKRPFLVALALTYITFFNACTGPSTTNQDGFSSNELVIRSFVVSPDTLLLLDNSAEISEIGFSATATFENADRLAFPLFIYVEDQASGDIYNSYEVTEASLNDQSVTFNGIMTLPKAGLIDLRVVLQSSMSSGSFLRAEQSVLAKSATNEPPVLLEIVYPATATIPATGQNAVGFFAQASDPQGVNDILGVYMDIFTKSTQNFDGQLVLLDNGNPANGDQIAGDGIYTAVVGLTPTSTPRTFELYTYVIDRQGLSSDTLKSEFTTLR
jgi:hypothetical protein